MSPSNELQKLVYERLLADAGVHAIAGDGIYDTPPETAAFPYISLGPGGTVEDDAECITGGVETFQVDCWSRYQGGFKEVKNLAHAVKKALHHFDGELETHALVEMQVLSQRFEDDPDGITSHGIVTVQAIVEEN